MLYVSWYLNRCVFSAFKIYHTSESGIREDGQVVPGLDNREHPTTKSAVTLSWYNTWSCWLVRVAQQ